VKESNCHSVFTELLVMCYKDTLEAYKSLLNLYFSTNYVLPVKWVKNKGVLSRKTKIILSWWLLPSGTSHYIIQ